jgi:hypothetical protein
MASQTLEHPLTKSAATRAEARPHDPVFKGCAAPAPRTGPLARAEPAGDLYATIIACAVEDRSGKH